MESYPLLVGDVWGIASLRQCCGFPDAVSPENTCYNAPLGASFVRWDFSTKERVLCFQAHKDLVTVMTRSCHNLILSISYGGELKVWSPSYMLLDSMQLATDCLVFGSWSENGDKFSLCSRGPRSMIAVYQVGQPRTTSADTKVVLLWKFSSPHNPNQSDDQSGDFVTQRSSTEGYNCFSACVFKQFQSDLGDEVLAIQESGMGPCDLCLFSSMGKIIKKVAVAPLGVPSSMVSLSHVKNHMLAVGLEQGLFAIYSDDSLNLLHIFTVGGSPVTCLWDGEELMVLSYLSGILSWWTPDGQESAECKGGPTGSIVHADRADLTSRSYWVGGIMSLSYLQVMNDRKLVSSIQTLSYHNLTGCGLAAHGKHDVVASGDFTGCVYVWKNARPQPIDKLSLSDSVRCLVWWSDFLLIGTLLGDLFSQPVDFTEEPKESVVLPSLLYQFGGGVVCCKISNDGRRLAVGLTTGYLHVFRVFWDSTCKDAVLSISELFSVLAHAPVTEPALRSMEIWSLCWSPNDAMLATSSEDQTTIICDSSSGSSLRTLTGHTTAVTSVDWKVLSLGANLLITCADDRTVRIHCGISFSLLLVLNTFDIYGWHTLTYLAVNPLANEIAVVTQNGFVVVWKAGKSSDDNKLHCTCITKQKMHGGSIEGLSWSSDYKNMYTIGSDCVVSRFCINEDFISSNL